MAFAFFAVGIRFILRAGTLKPRRGRQADPAAKRCQATRSPKRGELRLIYVRLVGTSSPRRPAGLMRGWLCSRHFRVLTLRRIVGAVGGLGIVSDLGFYGSQPSRTFSEKRPCRTIREIREIRGGNVSSFWISSGRHFRRFRLFRGRNLLPYAGLVKRGWKRCSTCSLVGSLFFYA